jgi:hypothetical protein
VSAVLVPANSEQILHGLTPHHVSNAQTKDARRLTGIFCYVAPAFERYFAVEGWMERGKPVVPFTDFAGAFNRHTGAAPYALPASWLAAKDKIQLTQTLNFVTTNDIIGGNSGSPMINRKAEIVGLAFDGNKHTHSGAYWFDQKFNRTVGVTSDGILEALKSIYGATELLAEIRGKQ